MSGLNFIPTAAPHFSKIDGVKEKLIIGGMMWQSVARSTGITKNI